MSSTQGVLVGAGVFGCGVVGAGVGGGVGGAVVGADVRAGVTEAISIVIDGSGENELDAEPLGDGDVSAAGPPGRPSTISRPKAITAMSVAARNVALSSLDPIALGSPWQSQLARRGHVPEQRG